MGAPKKVVYIAGKVTGLDPDAVALKFTLAAQRVRELGFLAINPIEVVNDFSATWQGAMRSCITALMTADAVLALPCSDTSNGAAIELELCNALCIPVYSTYKELKNDFPPSLAGGRGQDCTHPREHQFIDTIESTINCEATVIRCAVCRKALTEPQTDCR